MLIAIVAIMNAGGRVLFGKISDRIGRTNTLYIVILMQMLNMLAFQFYTNPILIVFGFIVVGLCFGAFLAIFPALTADQYGLKNFGFNYGIVYLAYAVGALLANPIADALYGRDGHFVTVYIFCAIMMIIAIIVNFLLKRDIKLLAKKEV
jgi:MFS family permease